MAIQSYDDEDDDDDDDDDDAEEEEDDEDVFETSTVTGDAHARFRSHLAEHFVQLLS